MIRMVTAEDFAAWEPLWKAYQVFYEVTIPDETSRVTWQRLLDPAERMWGALAFRDGHAVGFVHYLTHRTNWTIGDNCYLQDLFVAPDLRGGGIGRALIEHVYAAAREQGWPKVYWLTHETNVAAQTLYGQVAERTGFIQYRKQF